MRRFRWGLRPPNEDRDAPAGCGPLPMPERARHAVNGSEGVAAVQRIRRHYESSRIGVDGSGPGARGHLGGPRQCLRVDILPDVRQFAISNGNGEDPMVLERPIRGFDSPRSEADDQNPVSLRYELGGLWVGSFHRFVSLMK